MIKSSLVKGFVFGLCLSALSTGAVFATEAGASQGSAGKATTAFEDRLFALQKEVDQIVFVEKADEIEKMGFMVNYTGVAEEYVEIGISPYSKKHADYLYDLFGKDLIKVVEFDQSIIYATGGPVDEVPEIVSEKEEEAITDKEKLYTTTEPELRNEGIAADEKVYKGSEENKEDIPAEVVVTNDGDIAVDIAVDSVDSEATDTKEAILYTTTADDGEVLEMAEAEVFEAVKRNVDIDADNEQDVNAPMMILAIAGAAAIIGGTILVGKKKTKK